MLRLAIQIILIGLVFFFLGRKIYQDWGDIEQVQWELDKVWLVLSIFFFCCLYIGHASGWLLILWRFKHPVPFLPGTYIWFKSLLARYVPGNVLMVVGRVMMTGTYDVPKRISLTSVAYEQAMLAASGTAVLAVALPFWPKLQDVSWVIWLVLLVPPLCLIGLHPTVLGRFGNYVFRKLGRETIEQFLPFGEIVWIFFYYCFFWAVSGMALFAMVRSVSDIGISDLPIVIASTALAWLTSVLFFISPGGLGVREGVYAFTLDFAFSSAGAASLFAIFVRFVQTIIEIALTALFMAIVKIKHYKFKTPESESG